MKKHPFKRYSIFGLTAVLMASVFIFLMSRDILTARATITDKTGVGTDINVSNYAPSFTLEPSDGGSSATTPTNIGDDVVFTAIATDKNSNNYYLAICKTNSITAHDSAAPTCETSDQQLCVSSSTASGTGTTCSFNTTGFTPESQDWYAFVCDDTTDSQCSAAMQGIGKNGSPFNVNHAPSFTNVKIGPTCGSSALPNPTLLYKFDSDVSGGVVTDNSGNGHNASCSGSCPTWTSNGKYGGAYDFNGGVLSFDATNPSIPSGYDPRTICMWLNPSNVTGDASILTMGPMNWGNNSFRILRSLGVNLWIESWGGDTLNIPNFFVQNEWKHLCVTYDGTNATVYGNGVNISGPTPMNLDLSPATAYIGQDFYPSGFWAGTIDDFRIYNQALSAEDITQIYHNDSGQIPPGNFSSAGTPYDIIPMTNGSPGFGIDPNNGNIVDAGNGNSIVFMASANGSEGKWRAQKINSSGVNQWGTNGIEIGNFTTSHNYLGSVSDGANGALAVWSSGGSDILAQRIKSDGTLGFPEDFSLAPEGQCHDSGEVTLPFDNTFGQKIIISDGTGGFIAVWNTESAFGRNICTQRVDGNGNRLWGEGGIFLGGGNQPSIAEDGNHGAFIIWADHHFGTNISDARIIHIDSNGSPVTACTSDGQLISASAIPINVNSDANGGGVVLLKDINDNSIKAQHIDGSCSPDSNWPADGAVISTSGNPTSTIINSDSNTIMVALSSASAPLANLISLTDGTSLWGGTKEILSGTLNGVNPVFAVSSGSDFIFALNKITNTVFSNGSYAVKLLGATGLPDPAWPAEGKSFDLPYNGSVVAVMPDDNGGMKAILESIGLYSQDISSNGDLLWPTNNRVSDDDFVQGTSFYPWGTRLVSAPNGRVAVFWSNFKSLAIGTYSSVNMQIFDNGQALGPVIEISSLSHAIPNSLSPVYNAFADSTGFYVLWEGSDGKSLIQKTNLDGVPQWTPGGVSAIDTTATAWNYTAHLRMISDGAGGAIVAYVDTTISPSIRVQRINSSGARENWGSDQNGVIVGESDENNHPIFIASDGSGGAYLSWTNNGDVYMSRINSSGEIYTGFENPGKVVLGTAAIDETAYNMVADGQGNAFIFYQYDNSSRYLVQKINGIGTPVWPGGGVPIDTIDSSKWIRWSDPVLGTDDLDIPDGNGGIILSWSAGNYDIYTQKLDSNGIPQWGTVSTAHLASALTGSEDTVTVDSTTGFSASGMIKIGGNLVSYTGLTATEFIGCTNVPVASSGDSALQYAGIMAGGDYSANANYSLVSDGSGGAAFTYFHQSGDPGSYVSFISSSGNLLYGGEQLIDPNPFVYTMVNQIVQSGQSYFMLWSNGQNFLRTNIISPGHAILNDTICVQSTVTDTDSLGYVYVDMYVCDTNSFVNGACGGATLCSATGVASGSNAQCIAEHQVPVPTAHGNYPVYIFIKDIHGLQGTGTPENDYTVADVPPRLVSYTATDSPAPPAGGYDTVDYSVSLTDDNGDRDVNNVKGVFFDKTLPVTHSCAANENNCYISANCTLSDVSSDGSGKTATGTDNALGANCSTQVYFNALPGDWDVEAVATDHNGDTAFADAGVSLNNPEQLGIDVLDHSIVYGAVAINATSDSQTTRIANMGNKPIDVFITGDQMCSPSSQSCDYNIPAEQQKWSTSQTYDWDAEGNALVTTPSGDSAATGCDNANIGVRADHTVGSTDTSVFWKLRIPASQHGGSYSGQNTFTTTADNTCQ
jgi:hypothetical protein